MASTLDKARLWFLSVAAKFRRNSNPSIPKSPGGTKTNINRKILQGKKVENKQVMVARNDCTFLEMYFTFKWLDNLLNYKQPSEPVDENNHKGDYGWGASDDQSGVEARDDQRQNQQFYLKAADGKVEEWLEWNSAAVDAFENSQLREGDQGGRASASDDD
ncbi:hypothetical protein COLO4_25691 [Corchorus olitorius]|uniref:Uncharacterized protein n=1 Tax=Corchorus olitorius TaxID=93759 RepID=A0A1R3I0D2_9ROSI|nr:hypothetical protein COLO4_25691 [Corchorus olitorius]